MDSVDTSETARAPSGALVRRARDADALAVDEVRVAGWQTAYRGIVDDAYLDAMRADPHRFAAALEDRSGVAHYVAESGGEVAGWCCIGPARDADAPVSAREIYACYVHPARWRGGIGRALMQAALAEVPATAPVLLWALRDNDAALTFYARQGFAPDGAKRDTERAGLARGPREVRYRRPGRGER